MIFHYGLSQDIEYSLWCMCSRPLWVIHPIYNTLYLLIPTPSLFLSHSPPLDNHKNLLYICESLHFVLLKYFFNHLAALGLS